MKQQIFYFAGFNKQRTLSLEYFAIKKKLLQYDKEISLRCNLTNLKDDDFKSVYERLKTVLVNGGTQGWDCKLPENGCLHGAW